ncbi:MAG: type I restriction enzyme HsdR N-terminal domain-containing protein [Saprospiraceae bacterium]|nr:type I restriction enzyme HsdR N-terminal domain-containing protein [Saprospiraceae bacterium]
MKIKNSKVFDPVRQKWYVFTPEEKVRQCLIIWLNKYCQIPYSRMAVEKKIVVFNRLKRFDLLVYDQHLKAKILFECKEPGFPIHQSIFNQAAVYNFDLKAPFLGICNGFELIVAEIDFLKNTYQFTDRLPNYPF